MPSVDVLVISVLALKHERPHSHPDRCTFDTMADFSVDVAVDDGTGTPNRLQVLRSPTGQSMMASLPAQPRPLRLSIKITPTGANAGRYWDVGGDIEYRGNAIWGVLPTTPVEFQSAPQSFFQRGVTATAFLNVWLPRVKDVTAKVLDRLRTIPSDRLAWQPTPLTTWKVSPASTSFISSPPVAAGAIQVEGPAMLDPDTTDLVFEIKGFRTPQLMAMSWPNRLPFALAARDPKATFLQAAPGPFLIFFHAQHGQNMPPHGKFYVNGQWPYGWDFLYFGLYRYMTYNGDVIQNWGSLGLPIQVRRSGKNCIVLVPQNKFGPQGPSDEIVEFNDPELVQETLEEIQAYMYFRAGMKFIRPNLGRTAAGSMSNGNVLLTAFLNTHPGKPFLQNTLREVYVFDPNGSDDGLNAAPVDAALAWARFDPNADKMIRYFSQKVHPVHTRLLGHRPPEGNFVQDGKNAKFTAGVLSDNAWLAVGALDSNRQSNPDWQTAHQLIPGMLLTYAFGRSGFA